MEIEMTNTLIAVFVQFVVAPRKHGSSVDGDFFCPLYCAT